MRALSENTKNQIFSVLSHATEPNPLAVDRIRAASLVGVCPRSFDEYFRDVPKIKIGARTVYMVRDLMTSLESKRVEASSPMLESNYSRERGVIATSEQTSAESDAKGGF